MVNFNDLGLAATLTPKFYTPEGRTGPARPPIACQHKISVARHLVRTTPCARRVSKVYILCSCTYLLCCLSVPFFLVSSMLSRTRGASPKQSYLVEPTVAYSHVPSVSLHLSMSDQQDKSSYTVVHRIHALSLYNRPTIFFIAFYVCIGNLQSHCCRIVSMSKTI